MSRLFAARVAVVVMLLTGILGPVAVTLGQQAPTDPAAAFLATYREARDQPERAQDLWAAFAKANEGHDLGLLSRLLAGMAMLRRGGDAAKAGEWFVLPEPPTEAAPFRRQLSLAAKGLQARIKMRSLAEQLDAYHRKHIEYPAALADLVKAGLAQEADLLDPFGQPFEYEARPRRIMPDKPRQAFTLRCKTAGVTHADIRPELEELAQPLKALAVSSLRPEASQAFVRLARKDGSMSGAQAWMVGAALPQPPLTLWAVYADFLVAGDRGYPRLVLKE